MSGEEWLAHFRNAAADTGHDDEIDMEIERANDRWMIVITGDDFADVPELEHAPKWDGAGPDATVTRLLAWATAKCSCPGEVFHQGSCPVVVDRMSRPEQRVGLDLEVGVGDVPQQL